MSTSARHLTLSSPSSYLTNKSSSLNDLIQKFYTLVENVKDKHQVAVRISKEQHQNEVKMLNDRICELETENRRLQTFREQHPHSIFDIDYVSSDSSRIKTLQTELENAQQKINLLQAEVDRQSTDYDDMLAKHHIRSIINEKNNDTSNSSTDSTKVKELEMKLKQIRDQINQFEQCHFESDEQIRLLKQLILTNDSEQINTITQSLTVKQADLHQQTDIMTNILNRQQEKIMEKLMHLFEQSSSIDHQMTTTTTLTKNKKPKRKRL